MAFPPAARTQEGATFDGMTRTLASSPSISESGVPIPSQAANAAYVAYPANPYLLPDKLGELMRQLLSVLRRNLWLLISIVAGFLGAALVLTMLATPRYTAGTSVQINDQSDQVLGEELDTQTQATSGWDTDRFLNTQLGVVRSRALADRVAKTLNLFRDEAFYTAMGGQPPEGAANSPEVREAAIGLLQGNMKVDLPYDSRVAKITFTSTDAAMSARIANSFADQFIEMNLQRRFDSSAYARNFVSGQLDEARVRLEDSERKLNAYAREAGLIRTRGTNSDDENAQSIGSVTAASLMQLNQAANAAQAERVTAEARWNAESAAPLLSSQAVLSSSAVQALMQERAKAEAELQEARTRYLSDHPTVKALESHVAAARSQLNRTAQEVRNSVRAEYVAARAAEDRLKGQVTQLQGATLAEQDRSVRYNTLAREADTNRSIYEGLLQRFRELNASAGITSSNIAIIDKADPPLAPSSPNLFKNLAIALALGGAVALAAVFLRDQFDDRVRSPEDVGSKLALSLLGVIPLAASDNPLDELGDPKSALSEAYHSLRGSLAHSTPDGFPKILVIASAEPSEGKSTSSFAVARGLARMGRKVVLVDGDMRRPQVHHHASFDNRRGLSSLLTSRDPAESAIIPSGEDNLSLLPSGPIPPSPTELLAAPRMAALLEELGARFDAVIIDCPPVLGLADAPLLAAIADGTVIVIESNRGRRGALKAALGRLRAVRPNLLGAVLTKFDPVKSGSAYSGYYGYQYYRYGGDGEARA